MKYPSPPSWARPLQDHIEWMRAAGRPESSIYQRGYHLRRFAEETGLDPFAVTMDDLVHYLSGHDWGRSTRHSVRSALRTFYRWACDTGRMSSNPADRLPAVQPPAGRPRPAPETAVEAGLHAADERVRLMVMLAASAGLRCLEIARVHTDDLFEDLDGWSLRVLGKGSRRRVVPLTRRLALALRALPHGYAFPGQVDGHLSAAYVSKLMSRALPDGVTAHMLRHRFASRAYGAQRDIRAVQELLGHSSVATTQVYTKVPDGALRAAVNAA
ncbi:MAG: tyrosine-type recombinase/integrase [Microbacterium sp.]|jgi:integrase|nr:tyrosine-type recombinase/integrase [Microbacterium sp.]